MFDLNQFAAEVHQNAIDHGFWDDDATDERQIALIHSEWSEALQADRNGEPPVVVCMELIDGALRILDFSAQKGFNVKDWGVKNTYDFFNLLCTLHTLTSKMSSKRDSKVYCSMIPSLVFAFCRSYQIDPYELMRCKHEYNLTRPKKHDKRY